MPTTIKPFLMFEGTAEEAMTFYVGLVPDPHPVRRSLRPGRTGAEGSVVVASFVLAGLDIMCSDSPIEHAFSFTPSTSLFVTCASDTEIERLAGALLDGGEALMPLDDYGFSSRFAWVNDRFGVSWQLNLE